MGAIGGRSARAWGRALLAAAAGCIVSSCGAADEGPRAPLITAEAIARWQLLTTSCGRFPVDVVAGTLGFYDPGGLQVSREGPAFFDRVACLAEPRQGCAGLEDCLATTAAVAPELCQAAPCEGSVVQTCTALGSGLYSVLRTDCASFGLACGEYGCVSTGAPCDERTHRGRCVAGAPIGCEGGVEQVGMACGLFGQSCVVDDRGDRPVARCEGESPLPCQRRWSQLAGRELHGLGCSGTRLRACGPDGSEAYVDCGAWVAGASCQQAIDPGAGEPVYFCGVASECDPFSDRMLRCEGDALVFCNGGRLERLDCKTLGFAACGDNGYGNRCLFAPPTAP
ncbi:MAG TPA: hypothetical protein VFS43_08905 [Polyangiaceae bacterium]|nr:hypothetical protein [Polyangiaceae bacterium]